MSVEWLKSSEKCGLLSLKWRKVIGRLQQNKLESKHPSAKPEFDWAGYVRAACPHTMMQWHKQGSIKDRYRVNNTLVGTKCRNLAITPLKLLVVLLLKVTTNLLLLTSERDSWRFCYTSFGFTRRQTCWTISNSQRILGLKCVILPLSVEFRKHGFELIYLFLLSYKLRQR